MKNFQKYIKEVIQELKKVSWPTKEELKGSTIVVLGFTAVMSAIVWVFDFGLSKVIEFVMNSGSPSGL